MEISEAVPEEPWQRRTGIQGALMAGPPSVAINVQKCLSATDGSPRQTSAGIGILN